MDSCQGFEEGLCNTATSLSKLQASQDLGLTLSAGICQYKPALGFPVSVGLRPCEHDENGMVRHH